MSTLKEILDFEKTIDFFQQGANGIITVICTTKNSEEFSVWKGDKQESILGGLKDYTVHIGVWVCICEKESFGYLMSTVHKIVISLYKEYEIGTYFTQPKELLDGCKTVVESLLLFLVYLFRRNVGKDVVKKALGNNQLPNAIVGKDSTLIDVCQVHKQEVCLEALHAILLSLLLDKVSIVCIYGGGALFFLALVS